MLCTQDVRVLVPHGARDGRAQLLDRPHDEMLSRADSRLRAQSAWKDGQTTCAAEYYSARLRCGRVFVEEGDSAGAVERSARIRAMPAQQDDCSSRRTATASQCWWQEVVEQCNMDSRASSRTAAAYVRECILPLCRAQRVRSYAWRNQRVCCMNHNVEGCQSVCVELFALCRDYSWI
jgi:hypothetical protein